MRSHTERFKGEEGVLLSLAISIAMICLAVIAVAVWKNIGWLLSRLHEFGFVK